METDGEESTFINIVFRRGKENRIGNCLSVDALGIEAKILS